jgi:putative hydrolase of the HAD superfamily
VLDFGGVLWHMRWDVARALERAHGLPRGALAETLYRTSAWAAVERGRGDAAAWRAGAHALLEARAGRTLPPLHALWEEAQHLLPDNAALARALRRRHRVALLSNADLSLRGRLGGLPGLAGAFDAVVVSAEAGVAKPEPAAYRLAAERLGLPPAACLFVDDHEPNVAGAAAVGMRALHYRADRGPGLAALLRAAGADPDAGPPA